MTERQAKVTTFSRAKYYVPRSGVVWGFTAFIQVIHCRTIAWTKRENWLLSGMATDASDYFNVRYELDQRHIKQVSEKVARSMV